MNRIFPRRAGLALLLVLVLVLGGCAVVGPSFQPPVVAPPARWNALPERATGAAPLPANRWTVFGDPVLLRLQALAAPANQDVKVAALRLLQARVNEATVSAQGGPRLDAHGAGLRQRQSESGAATRVAGALGGGAQQQQIVSVLSAPFSVYQAGFDASWEPDLWGRVARAEEAARADGDGQQALLRQVQLSVRAEVARQYFQLRAVQRQRQLVDAELAVALDVQQVIEAQWQGGLTDQSALIKQRALVAGLQASLPALDAQQAQAGNQIAMLCAATPGALHAELAAERATSDAALPDLRLGLPSELVRQRPDLAAAEASLHAATADIGLAMADLYPRITIGASFGAESVDSGKFGDWGSRQWSLGPSLSIPLFDRGRRHSIVTLRELRQQQAAVTYQQAVLKAWHEVDDAIANYLAETQRGEQFARKIGLAEDQAQLARTRFANGMSTWLPVANEETALLEARRELADNRGRRNTALAALFKALGDGGTAPDAE
ncbi:MAG: efflux transporter outer membrane subunit [Pseudomonadota bacterium]|nr:efflux transporter outer membrane subunit [Pseudomonadota bacterium]